MAPLTSAPLSTFVRPWLDRLPELRSFFYERFIYAYVAAYDGLIAYIHTQAKTMSGLSEEIEAYPDLLDFFVSYLIDNAEVHIDPRQSQGVGQVLDEQRLGTFNDFVAWVDSGYQAKRTEENYQQRLLYWQKDIWANKEKYRKVVSKRQIYSRLFEKVPYWLVWNYGSMYIYRREGHPNFPGLFFIEHVLTTLDIHKERARTDILNGALEYLLNRTVPTLKPTLEYLTWSDIYPALYQKVVGG